jgi:16S rRNA processing protein RimM
VPEPPQKRPPKSADVRAGTLVGAFGLRGELKLAASRVGDDALRAGVGLKAHLPDGSTRALVVRSVRRHQGRPLIAFEGVDDVDAAQPLIRADLDIARSDAPLGTGEYFDDDLVGCRIVDIAGVERGTVVAVQHYPAQDYLVVGNARALLPLVGAFIRAVDLDARTIEVDVPPGLLDPENAGEA